MTKVTREHWMERKFECPWCGEVSGTNDNDEEFVNCDHCQKDVELEGIN